MAATAEKKDFVSFSGLSMIEIAQLCHEVVGCMRRALRDDKHITPWGMLSNSMQGLLVLCVEAVASNPKLPVLALMNGFYINHAKLMNQAPAPKRVSITQYSKPQVLIWTAFHGAAVAALFGPEEV